LSTIATPPLWHHGAIAGTRHRRPRHAALGA
jgi:hypothetical protein